MNIRYFKTFIAVAESRGISKACESLCLTQPAVTRQIRILEEEYNAELFDRRCKEIILTEEGKKLLEYAREIVDIYNNSLSSLSKQCDQQACISIAADYTIGTYILPRFLKYFIDNYQNIKIEMNISEKERIIKALKSGLAVFGFVDSDPKDNNIISRLFYRDNLSVVVSKKAAIKKITNLKDLCDLPFISLDKRSAIWAAYSSWFRKRKGEKGDFELNPKIELNNIEAVKAFLHLNMGYSILPSCAVEQDVNRGLLEKLHIEKFSLFQNYYICYLNQEKPSRIVGLFLDFFADYYTTAKGI